jgi:hypothetical protein
MKHSCFVSFTEEGKKKIPSCIGATNKKHTSIIEQTESVSQL